MQPLVRSAARAKLSSLYSRHLADGAAGSQAPAELEMVPQMLLQCYGAEATKDLESRLEIETLLTRTLLPKAEGRRLAVLGVVHRALTAWGSSPSAPASSGPCAARPMRAQITLPNFLGSTRASLCAGARGGAGGRGARARSHG